MEELNKSQIVLLTLLVSFATSLATGIVTVSLMEQGVKPVYSTVNQIVERTKEIIVKVPEPQDPIIITETKEIIVHQSDLVAAAVEKNKRSSIILYKKTLVPKQTEDIAAAEESETTTEATSTTEGMVATPLVAVEALEGEVPEMQIEYVFTSRAVVLSGGVIIADASTLEAEAEYTIRDVEGAMTAVTLQGKQAGIAVFSKPQAAVGKAAVIGDTAKLSRGQAVIVLLGTDRLRVITAIVSDILIESEALSAIEIDKSIRTPGSMLINTDGKLIGISTGTSRTHGDAWFAPSNSIQAALE